jgi:RNA-directed DNA polymerase
LAAFFDHVNHDRLMSRLGRYVADRRIRWTIRGFLRAGVMEQGVLSATTEGTPQGGPLSPLLANLVLDELDKELERRGLRFVRYADDCNVYCGSERAASKAFENLIGFIEGKLKLKVNRQKSAVAQPWQRKLLGFSFTSGPNPKRRIAPKSLAKARARIRQLTRPGHASFEATMTSLRRYLLGWLGYYRHCQTPSALTTLEVWVRRRLRCLIWRHWKRAPRRKLELLRRGVSPKLATEMAGSPQGAWHLSRTPPMSIAFPNRWFAAHGLPPFVLAT